MKFYLLLFSKLCLQKSVLDNMRHSLSDFGSNFDVEW